jgi:hypothetical protein
MKRPVILIVLFCAGLACTKYPDPEIMFLKNYSFAFQTGQGMKFLSGEWVSDSVRFYAVNSNNPLKDSVKVLFEVIKGGGNITVPSAYTDKNGFTCTGWKLGSETFEQKLRAKTYDASGNYLTSTDLIEYGFRNDTWDTCSSYPDGNIIGMVADTVNKFTLMIAYGGLYKQGERYYEWDKVDNPVLNSPGAIKIDRNGIIYVTTWSGDLIKSSDHGVTWKTCTKPYPDYPYFVYSTVSNDNYIWVFQWDHNTRFSKDGGITWNDAGSNLSSYGYGNVFRLKDGSLLFHGSNCCSLNRSFDDGFTWTKIETPGYSIKLYVNDKDEILIVTQENGITIYKSTDYCSTFTRETSVSPQWGTSDNDNIFNKWGNFYYVLIPGWGILKSADLVHYEQYWYNSNLRDLFIDHNGVLIAKDWQSSTVYYRKNSDK